MARDLSTSAHDRQNILNNNFALEQAEKHLDLGGVEFEGELVFTKSQVIDLFDVSEATIERYLVSYGDELKQNGYILLKGKKLKEFKDIYYGTLINEGTTTSVLGVFTFRTVLNLSMLLTESDKARELRSKLLDIALDVVTQRTGGQTKYINQRDEDYLVSALKEDSYRQLFTDALDHFVEGNKWKYARFTNLIYQSIFKENAAEYKKILNLADKDNLRETLYSEVLRLIASFESGLAHELEQKSKKEGRRLTQSEAESLIFQFEEHPLYRPYIFEARTKMASRDLCFRDALHEKLEAYVDSVPQADFEKFLGEKSKSLEERLSDPETLAVLKRLKDR